MWLSSVLWPDLSTLENITCVCVGERSEIVAVATLQGHVYLFKQEAFVDVYRYLTVKPSAQSRRPPHPLTCDPLLVKPGTPAPPDSSFNISSSPYVVLLSSWNESAAVTDMTFTRMANPTLQVTSPEGLLTLHTDNTMRIWSLHEGRCMQVLPSLVDFECERIHSFPDSRFAVLVGLTEAALVDIWRATCLAYLRTTPTPVGPVASQRGQAIKTRGLIGESGVVTDLKQGSGEGGRDGVGSVVTQGGLTFTSPGALQSSSSSPMLLSVSTSLAHPKGVGARQYLPVCAFDELVGAVDDEVMEFLMYNTEKSTVPLAPLGHGEGDGSKDVAPAPMTEGGAAPVSIRAKCDDAGSGDGMSCYDGASTGTGATQDTEPSVMRQGGDVTRGVSEGGTTARGESEHVSSSVASSSISRDLPVNSIPVNEDSLSYLYTPCDVVTAFLNDGRVLCWDVTPILHSCRTHFTAPPCSEWRGPTVAHTSSNSSCGVIDLSESVPSERGGSSGTAMRRNSANVDDHTATGMRGQAGQRAVNPACFDVRVNHDVVCGVPVQWRPSFASEPLTLRGTGGAVEVMSSPAEWVKSLKREINSKKRTSATSAGRRHASLTRMTQRQRYAVPADQSLNSLNLSPSRLTSDGTYLAQQTAVDGNFLFVATPHRLVIFSRETGGVSPPPHLKRGTLHFNLRTSNAP
eukprot:GHVN01051235.1.p1 GENE.GHVN01051235.1~~GHVN01051235.1.p1  ORF type:complete len:687 (+),score=120.37 GHVN01051235.1:120-2180(+)